jgi:hypothetical protein
METNQLGRRNLSPDQRSLLRGRIYNRTRKTHGGQIPGSVQNAHSIKTAELLAAKHGVNESTIRRDGKRAELFEELEKIAREEADAVRRGKKRLNEVRRTVAKAPRQNLGRSARIKPGHPPGRFSVVHRSSRLVTGLELRQIELRDPNHADGRPARRLLGAAREQSCQKFVEVRFVDEAHAHVANRDQNTEVPLRAACRCAPELTRSGWAINVSVSCHVSVLLSSQTRHPVRTA